MNCTFFTICNFVKLGKGAQKKKSLLSIMDKYYLEVLFVLKWKISPADWCTAVRHQKDTESTPQCIFQRHEASQCTAHVVGEFQIFGSAKLPYSACIDILCTVLQFVFCKYKYKYKYSACIDILYTALQFASLWNSLQCSFQFSALVCSNEVWSE